MVAPVVGAHGADEEEEGFKYYVVDMFVANTLIGLVAQKLYAKADRAGAEGVSELVRVGKRGKAKKHMHRDLMRKLMKCCTFIELYWCLVLFSQQRAWRRGIP